MSRLRSILESLKMDKTRISLNQCTKHQIASYISRLGHLIVLIGFCFFQTTHGWTYQYFLQRQINELLSMTAPQSIDGLFVVFQAEIVSYLLETSMETVTSSIGALDHGQLKSYFVLSHLYFNHQFCMKISEHLQSPDFTNSSVELLSYLPITYPKNHMDLICSVCQSNLSILPSLINLVPTAALYHLTSLEALLARLKRFLPDSKFSHLPLLNVIVAPLTAIMTTQLPPEHTTAAAQLLSLSVLADPTYLALRHLSNLIFQPDRMLPVCLLAGILKGTLKSCCEVSALRVFYPSICRTLQAHSTVLLSDVKHLGELAEVYQLLVSFLQDNGDISCGSYITLEVIKDTVQAMNFVCRSVNTVLRQTQERHGSSSVCEAIRGFQDTPLNLLLSMEGVTVKARKEFSLFVHFGDGPFEEYLKEHFELIWHLLPHMHVDAQLTQKFPELNKISEIFDQFDIGMCESTYQKLGPPVISIFFHYLKAAVECYFFSYSET